MKYVFFILIPILLTSCFGNSAEVTTPANATPSGSGAMKKDMNKNENTFFIETKKISEFSDEKQIEKIGQILPSRSLDIAPQVSGEISQIHVQEGQSVGAGQVLISLKDSYSRYGLEVQKAQIDLERQQINKQSQILSLDKNIDDAKRNLDDAKRSYNNTLLTAAEDSKQAEIDFKNAATTDSSSTAYLNLEKAQLDYQNKVESDKQTVSGYVEDVKREYNNLYLNIVDITEFGDSLFGITDQYKNEAKDIREYFGVRDFEKKNETEGYLRNLILFKDELETLDTQNVSEETLLSFMESYRSGYTLVTDFLNALEETLNNSLASAGSLSDQDISGYVSQVNNYQNANQGDYSSFINSQKAISNFLATYKDDQKIALANLDITKNNYENSEENAQITYNKTLIQIENTVASAEKSYKSAQAAYDNAVANKDITIKSLDNTLASSRNNLAQAQADFAKLSIISPISGVVSSIDADSGAFVSNGNNLLRVVSDNLTQIEVSASSAQAETISVGDSVSVISEGKEFSGKVFSLSSVADTSLNYNVIITLNEEFNRTGGTATVIFSQVLGGVSIPLEIVEITDENTGYINTYKDGNIETFDIDLGKILGDTVEVFTYIPNDIEIITTDIKNYNSVTQTLTIKK